MGIAYFKRRVAQEVALNFATIPINEAVLGYINGWKKAGGRVILVTASDQSIANEFGKLLGIFDRLYGSNGKDNLKGDHKARFLVDQFGEKGFAYVGNSKADIKIWEHANRIIAVNLSRRMSNLLNRKFKNVKLLQDSKPKGKSILRLIRSEQWIKNTLVFLPILAANLGDIDIIIKSLWAFIVFCFTASSIYILNDAFDLQHDRNHPEKKNRPIAAGSVQIFEGIFLGVAFMTIGLGISLYIEWDLFLVMSLYLLLNFSYSAYFKKLIIIDLIFLSSFYILRVFAGSESSGVELSSWLIAFSAILFFALGSLKRLAEIVELSNVGMVRMPGRGYRISDSVVITQMTVVASFVSVTLLGFYINSDNVLHIYSSPSLLWCLVLLLTIWLNRLIFLTNQGVSGEPLTFFLKDRESHFYVILGILILYVAGL